jgi:tetratricopeptide (TPR) repeat protein
VHRRSQISYRGGLRRFGGFSRDFVEVLRPYTFSGDSSWEISLELWTDLFPDDLESVLGERFSDVFVEANSSVSLLGEGYHCYLLGTFHGFDIVRDTSSLLESLAQQRVHPLALAIDFCPNAEEAWLQARCYQDSGHPGLAARYYELAISLGCTSVDSGYLHLLAGLAHKDTGNLQEARSRLVEVERLTDNCSILSEAFQHLAAVEHEEGAHQAGLVQVRKALACDPESGIKRFNVANAYCLLGNYQEALHFLRQAFETSERTYLLEHVLNDADFEHLRMTTGFRLLLETFSD